LGKKKREGRGQRLVALPFRCRPAAVVGGKKKNHNPPQKKKKERRGEGEEYPGFAAIFLVYPGFWPQAMKGGAGGEKEKGKKKGGRGIAKKKKKEKKGDGLGSRPLLLTQLCERKKEGGGGVNKKRGKGKRNHQGDP